MSSGGFASLRAFHVNELSSPTDVKHANMQLHLRKFLLLQNMFPSIDVVSPKTHRTSPECIQIGGESQLKHVAYRVQNIFVLQLFAN